MLRPSPIQHESLADDQLERVRVIYQFLCPHLNTAFEQFELNFKRDENPEQEIQAWSRIALARQTFSQRNPAATRQEAERAFKALLVVSMRAPRVDDIPASIWESLEAIYEGP